MNAQGGNEGVGAGRGSGCNKVAEVAVPGGEALRSSAGTDAPCPTRAGVSTLRSPGHPP